MNDALRPKILYVISLAWWGGAQHYVFDMVLASKEAGCEVLVVCGEGELVGRLTTEGVKTHVISDFKRGLGLRGEVRSLQKLLQVTREFKPDIIHSNSSKSGFLGMVAGRVCRVKKNIFTAHGWAFTERRPVWQRLIFWFFHYLTVLLSDTTICVSKAIRRGARHMPGVQKRLGVIYNGVEPFELLEKSDARIRLAPTQQRTFWIGTIAELNVNKQLDTLIRAFALIASDYLDTCVAIMGDGSERQTLQSLIQELSLANRVTLCGHVEHARTYLRALDIFVLPSRTEALGYALLETGLAHLPAIASNVGGIPEIIRDNETGLLFPSGDVGALAACLRRCLDDSALRESMASSLYTHVTQNFSKSQMIEKTLSIYSVKS